MKTITVEVKQKHIKKGKRSSLMSCPIALAVKDAGFGYASVSYENVLFSRNDFGSATLGAQSFDLPKKASRFAKRFDDVEPVKPFSFRLRYEGN